MCKHMLQSDYLVGTTGTIGMCSSDVNTTMETSVTLAAARASKFPNSP